MSKREYLKHLGFHSNPPLMSNKLPAEQLPEEIKKEIKLSAKAYVDNLKVQCNGDAIYKVGFEEGYIAGATEWAIWKQRYDELKAQETTEVFVPCLEDDPRCVGCYTSTDGQSLCYVRESKVPVIQSGAVWVKGEAIGLLKWLSGYHNEEGERLQLHEGEFHFIDSQTDDFILAEIDHLVELFQSQHPTESGATDWKALAESMADDIKVSDNRVGQLLKSNTALCKEKAALKEKADKMEAALEEIITTGWQNYQAHKIAREALAWKGEVDKKQGEGYINPIDESY